MKKYSVFALLLFVGLSLLTAGCNTVRGFGEDISGSSNFVEKKMMGAEDNNTGPSNPPQWPK